MSSVESTLAETPGKTETSDIRGPRIALISAICVGILSIGPHLPAWWINRNAPHSWTYILATRTYDLDAILIHGGLLKAPRFLDTLHWWTGTWVGQVPFYRPLTSYLFWTEWKVFGEREWLWMVPGLLAHVAATALFGSVIFRLAQRLAAPSSVWAAVVASWGFSGYLLNYRSDVTEEVFNYWKNQPDSFAAICCFAALLCYLNSQQAGRSYSVGAVIWYLAACGFKEIAIPLPLVCACLERREDICQGSRSGMRRLALMAIAGGLFLSVRAIALGTIGYTYGRNADWLRRTAEELFGPFSSTLVRGEWLGNSVGAITFIAGLFLLRRLQTPIGRDVAPNGLPTPNWQLRAALPIIGATFAGWIVLGMLKEVYTDEYGRAAALSPIGPIVGLYRCLQPVTEGEILSTLVLLISIVVLYKRYPQGLVIGLVWTMAFLAPLMLSPSPIHRYYMSQGGYYVVYGLAAGICIPGLLSMTLRFRKDSNPLASKLGPG
jgi:hypothetical protein